MSCCCRPRPARRLSRALRRLRVMRKADDRLDALLDFACRFSALAAAAPWHRFVLEVNLVKWTADEARAVDGLLIIEEP